MSSDRLCGINPRCKPVERAKVSTPRKARALGMTKVKSMIVVEFDVQRITDCMKKRKWINALGGRATVG